MRPHQDAPWTTCPRPATLITCRVVHAALQRPAPPGRLAQPGSAAAPCAIPTGAKIRKALEAGLPDGPLTVPGPFPIDGLDRTTDQGWL
ncbi:hypothetical protein [Nonomuraea sp. B19D2]|uniref:hypothetical protein n=1 Tax=Nonomuraea sp. B19D2 TaxID=3159561 RepID=UPI0032DA3275